MYHDTYNVITNKYIICMYSHAGQCERKSMAEFLQQLQVSWLQTIAVISSIQKIKQCPKIMTVVKYPNYSARRICATIVPIDWTCRAKTS